MAVSVYKGLERPDKARRMGLFRDSIYMNKAEIDGGRIIVTDPLNREYYRSPVIPELENYAVQSIQCERSAQSGLLVVGVGGFYAGTSGQQSLTIATDYPIAEPVTHEEYLAGKR